MIDMDMKYIGSVIGLCGSCMKPITEGPGGNTAIFSCWCNPPNPLMHKRDDAAPDEGEGK